MEQAEGIGVFVQEQAREKHGEEEEEPADECDGFRQHVGVAGVTAD